MVNISREYTEQLGSGKIMALLEANGCWPGLYLYLGSRIAASQVGGRGQAHMRMGL